jgi:putative CocE/NonD family hydrolase
MTRQLCAQPSEFFDKTRVFIYVFGENRWRAEQAWPLPDAVPTKYYLHSGGSANTSSGDGTLSLEKPGAEQLDHYTADPANPVPTLLEHFFIGGRTDQSSNEKRNDVLVYSTPPLNEDVEVTGYIKATLYAASDATDTDFIMKLVDVDLNGTVNNLVTGGVRGRYRKSRTAPEALTPGKIERYEIAMRATSNVFKKGHRIRVEVMSSDAYMYDVNPNQFVDLRTATAKDYVVAEQTIYHSEEYPSLIELPVIPVGREREWIDWPYATEKTGGHDAFVAQNYTQRFATPIELDTMLLDTEKS